MLLAREVAAVADPHRVRMRAELTADASMHSMLCSTACGATAAVGVTEAAELVRVRLARLVLEGVRVHGVEDQPERRGMLAQLRRSSRRVPRECAAKRPAWRAPADG